MCLSGCASAEDAGGGVGLGGVGGVDVAFFGLATHGAWDQGGSG